MRRYWSSVGLAAMPLLFLPSSEAHAKGADGCVKGDCRIVVVITDPGFAGATYGDPALQQEAFALHQARERAERATRSGGVSSAGGVVMGMQPMMGPASVVAEARGLQQMSEANRELAAANAHARDVLVERGLEQPPAALRVGGWATYGIGVISGVGATGARLAGGPLAGNLVGIVPTGAMGASHAMFDAEAEQLEGYMHAYAQGEAPLVEQPTWMDTLQPVLRIATRALDRLVGRAEG